MKANRLMIGDTYTVRQSKKYPELVGEMVRIVNNQVVPDGLPNQRCVLVETDAGDQIYMIPRLLDDGTISISSPSNSFTPPPVRELVERRPITDPMDPRLDPYRPDPVVVKHYVARNLPGSLKDTELLMHYWRERDEHGYSQNVMLVGDTQSGKTMLVQVMACLISKELGYPKPLAVFTLSGSAGVTDFDMLGQPTAFTDEYGQEKLVWLSGIVDIASRVPCILYLDECNMMPERVTSTLHPVCDDRRTFVNRAKAVHVDGEYLPEQVKVNTGTWIIGTYNSGYKGAGAMNEAFTNRFRHLPWGYDDAVEKKLIKSPTVLLLGKALRDARNLRSINTPVGTKALQRLWQDAQSLGVEAAVWAFTGMFPETERPKVQSMLEDRSIEALLKDEIVNSDTINAPVTTVPEPVVEPF
jgi:energy-coupling factor transporter ATP-binding protein EcfA2